MFKRAQLPPKHWGQKFPSRKIKQRVRTLAALLIAMTVVFFTAAIAWAIQQGGAP